MSVKLASIATNELLAELQRRVTCAEQQERAQRKVDHRDRAIEMREQARRAKTLHPLVRRHFS